MQEETTFIYTKSLNETISLLAELQSSNRPDH